MYWFVLRNVNFWRDGIIEEKKDGGFLLAGRMDFIVTFSSSLRIWGIFV